MEDINVALIKKRSMRGVFTLTSWQFLSYFVAIAANFLLWLFLTPADFGVFFVVSAIISFLNYFSDIGLAGALIQKKDDITPDDLRTTFTIQQILVLTLVSVSFIFSFYIGSLYKISVEGVALFRVLIVSFFLSSLKTIPSVILERKLNFQLIIIPQILETVSYNSIVVFLAWKGFGVSSFTWAVLLRSILGVIALYLIAPWKPSFGISKIGAKKLLRFGIPFQLNSFLGIVKDDLLIVVLGYILPIRDIGYIGSAKKLTDMPIRMFMDTIIKVTFPAFSRIQHSKELLTKAIQTTLFGISSAIFPIFIIIIYLIDPIVHLVPRYAQWEPAILSFYFFAGANLIASISTPLTNVFNAVGKINITMKLMLFWIVSTWLLTLLFINKIGFHGYSLAVFLVSASVILVVHIAKRIAPFRLWQSIGSAVVGSILLAMVFILFRGDRPYSVIRVCLVTVFGMCIYGLYFWINEKEKIRNIISGVKS